MKNKWLEKIDDYLNDNLAQAEKQLFETLLNTNSKFLTLFRLHKWIENEMRKKHLSLINDHNLILLLEKLNKQYFSPDREKKVYFLCKNRNLLKMMAQVAASILIISIIGYTVLVHQSGMRQMAGKYTRENLAELSQTMDASREIFQQGINAFNNQEYAKAAYLFKEAEMNDSTNADAIQYCGLAYLFRKDYEEAMKQFDKLGKKKNLHVNPGKFLMAITLLHRSEKGDEIKAKKLLKEVIDEKLYGAVEAKEWLEY